jgi:hypothetical protein
VLGELERKEVVEDGGRDAGTEDSADELKKDGGRVSAISLRIRKHSKG